MTTDKNLKYQQNLSDRTVAIAVLPTPSWPVLKNHGNRIAEEIGMLKKNDFNEISLEPGNITKRCKSKSTAFPLKM